MPGPTLLGRRLFRASLVRYFFRLMIFVALATGTLLQAAPRAAEATGFVPIRINSGGGLYTDTEGHQWAAETGCNGWNQTSAAAISGTEDDPLYQSLRTGLTSCSYAVGNGTYQVTLKFAELSRTAPNQRKFDVKIEDQLVLDDFDMYALAGQNAALDRTFTITVVDGTLNLAFVKIVDNPTLAAISIDSGVDNTAPTITGRSPAPGATGVAGDTNVTAAFSEAMLPSSISTSTFSLSDPSDVLAATVSYDAATRTATLDYLGGSLQPGLVYTVRVKGGTNGVKDLAGNPLAADDTWTFTTATVPSLHGAPAMHGVGEPVAAYWWDIPNPSAGDWVGLFRAGASDWSPLARQSTGGTAAGSWTLTMPTTPGAYEFRLFLNDKYPRALVSNQIWAAKLSASPAAIAAGGKVTIQWEGIGPDTPPDDILNVEGWVVGREGASFSEVFPITPRPNGSKQVTLTQPGVYEAILNWTSNGVHALTTSSFFVPGLTATPTSTSPGGTVQACWNYVDTPTVGDWIALYVPGQSDYTPVAGTKQYTGANKAGCKDYTMPGAGTYEFRFFYNNKYPRLAVSAPISVSGQDITRPTITERTPAIGATGVALGANVAVVFSERMQAGTISGSNFTLVKQGGGTIAAGISYNDTTRTATLNPNADLEPGTAYLATVNGTVADLASNTLGADQTWVFTTLPAPNLLSPGVIASGGSVVFIDTLTPTFTWTGVDGATGYRLQVSRNVWFSWLVANVTTSNTSYALPPAQRLSPNVQYWWRVQASNGPGPWSAPFTFMTNALPGAPGLNGPAVGSTVANLTPTLDWYPASGPITSYHLQVATNSWFGTKVLDLDVTGSDNYTIGAGVLEPGKTYYWRVNATSGVGTGPYSATWNFKTP